MKQTLLALCLAFGACHHDTKPATTTPPAKEESLFVRLGGLDAIKPLVDDFAGNILADEKINARFKGVDPEKLKKLLVEQICHDTGGPCEYTGRDMETTHKGMKITDDEFGALVADLVKSLDKFKVNDKAKADLLTALGGMKPKIVGQ